MPVSLWKVEGGALTSTGTARGFLASDQNYGNFRIIFSGKHAGTGHNPTFLFWGESRTADAMSAIQLQLPTCGGWDYRPGHNDGITVTNPTGGKVTIDMTQWYQCEVLANMTEGTLRQACCQLEGDGSTPCQGVEFCLYQNVSAAYDGPLGPQIHQPGLYDEYKDICVETSPTNQVLITTQY